MGFQVTEVRPSPANGAIDVVVQDEHGNERILRVSDDGVQEVEQGMLIPVSDELEQLARQAAAPPPQLGDPAAPSPVGIVETYVSDEQFGEDRVSRPHIGTGDIRLPESRPKDPVDVIDDD
ncbi:MAG: hypothetical protein AAGE52_19925 [Myxococcota bacterium]